MKAVRLRFTDPTPLPVDARALVPAALAGVRKMPAKGGNPELSDLEVARAVIHMANAGGGRFAEPTSTDLARWRQKADKRRKK